MLTDCYGDFVVFCSFLDETRKGKEREGVYRRRKKGRNALATLFGLRGRKLSFDLSHDQKFSAWQYIQDYLQSSFYAL